MRDLSTELPASLCFDPTAPGSPRLRLRRQSDPAGDIVTAEGLVVCPKWIHPTYDALAECVEHGHDIVCLRGNRISALIHAQQREAGTQLRRQQFRRHANEADCMILAKSLVMAKTAGQLALIRRAARQRQDQVLDQRADRLERDRLTIPGAKTLDALRGSEGIVARMYFGGWPHLLKLSSFQRIPRRALNPINHLLDLCYSRLCLAVTLALLDHGFDLALGTLHSEDQRRPTLALDLMEPLRALIADRFVINVYRDALDGGWFIQEENRWGLTAVGRGRWRHRWDTWFYGGPRRSGQCLAVQDTVATYQAWIQGSKGSLRWPTLKG